MQEREPGIVDFVVDRLVADIHASRCFEAVGIIAVCLVDIHGGQLQQVAENIRAMCLVPALRREGRCLGVMSGSTVTSCLAPVRTLYHLPPTHLVSSALYHLPAFYSDGRLSSLRHASLCCTGHEVAAVEGVELVSTWAQLVTVGGTDWVQWAEQRHFRCATDIARFTRREMDMAALRVLHPFIESFCEVLALGLVGIDLLDHRNDATPLDESTPAMGTSTRLYWKERNISDRDWIRLTTEVLLPTDVAKAQEVAESAGLELGAKEPATSRLLACLKTFDHLAKNFTNLPARDLCI